MTEPDFETADAGESVRTGIPAVDEVVAAVDALAQEPLEHHVEVFGAAHERLRRALDPADES
jgi:hypothetical protein